MTHDFSTRMRLMSRLLDYPDSGLPVLLSEAKAAAESSPETDGGRALLAFVAHMAGQSLLHLQEHYTQTFDLAPSHCLDLTYHLYGDSQDRAHALQRMQEVYLQAGFEKINGELPDYLPLVLEFLSVAPERSKTEVLGMLGQSLAALAGNLRRHQNPYAHAVEHLMEALCLGPL